MSERRLVELSERDFRRLRAKAADTGDLLRSLADSYDSGITVEEAAHVLSATRGEIALRSAGCRLCEPIVAKLQTFTESDPDADH